MTSAEFIRQRGASTEAGAARDLSYAPLPEPLVVGVYDNHTHLEISDGDSPMGYREHLDRASSVGVRGVIQVGGDLETSRWSAAVAASSRSRTGQGVGLRSTPWLGSGLIPALESSENRPDPRDSSRHGRC